MEHYFLSYYVICVIYCFYQLSSSYRKKAMPGGLGVTPGMGKNLGVDEKWAYNIIKAVGNYGESFERNIGKNTPLMLERGLNQQWTKGGILYAWPIR